MRCLFLVFLGFQDVASFKLLPEELVFRFRGIPAKRSHFHSFLNLNQLRHAPAVGIMQDRSPSFVHALPYKPPPSLIALLCFGLAVIVAIVVISCSSFRSSKKKPCEPTLQHIGRGNEADHVLGSLHVYARAPSKVKTHGPSSSNHATLPDNSALIASPRRPTPSKIAKHSRALAEDLDVLMNPVLSAPTVVSLVVPLAPPATAALGNSTEQNLSLATPDMSMDIAMQ